MLIGSKNVEEVKKYALVFWERGSSIFPENEYNKIVQLVNNAQSARDSIALLTTATATYVGQFEHPLVEMSLPIEDRFLLCLTHIYGYGQWEKIRVKFCQLPRFQYNMILQSMTVGDISKRCIGLMKNVVLEIEKNERSKH